MKRVLLLGNGLNNLEGNSQNSWEGIVLNQIPPEHRNVFVDSNNRIKTFIPYPFMYDQFDNHDYLSQLMNFQITDLGREFLKKYDEIITTNFTTELMTDGKWVNNSIIKEKKYNLFRKYSNGTKTIWYIHGIVNVDKSIVMGQKHYIEQTGLIGAYLDGKYSLKDKGEKILSMEDRLRNGNIKITNESSWIDYFFLPDYQIDIVGLTMSFSELDLWYVLKRRREFSEQIKNNKVIFHCLESTCDYDKCRDKILELNGVKINNHNLSYKNTESYKNLYEDILKM